MTAAFKLIANEASDPGKSLPEGDGCQPGEASAMASLPYYSLTRVRQTLSPAHF